MRPQQPPDWRNLACLRFPLKLTQTQFTLSSLVRAARPEILAGRDYEPQHTQKPKYGLGLLQIRYPFLGPFIRVPH